MESVTVNMEGLNEFLTQFGPMGYIAAHGIVAMFFGLFAWRNVMHAGDCHGAAARCDGTTDEQKRSNHLQACRGNVYIVRATISGVIAITNVIFVLAISAQLCAMALDEAKLNNKRNNKLRSEGWTRELIPDSVSQADYINAKFPDNFGEIVMASGGATAFEPPSTLVYSRVPGR